MRSEAIGGDHFLHCDSNANIILLLRLTTEDKLVEELPSKKTSRHGTDSPKVCLTVLFYSGSLFLTAINLLLDSTNDLVINSTTFFH